MILDALTGIIVSMVAVIVGAALFVFALIINIITSPTEAIVGLFFSGFTLGCIETQKWQLQTKANKNYKFFERFSRTEIILKR